MKTYMNIKKCLFQPKYKAFTKPLHTIYVQEWLKTKVWIVNDALGNLNTVVVLVDSFVA